MAINHKNGYQELLSHVGHNIEVVVYAGYNVAAECVSCGEVLFTYDWPGDVDILRGEELARGVADERGRQMAWERKETKNLVYWADENGTTVMSYPKVFGDPPQNFRPDKFIDQAWTLDGDGWCWSFAEAVQGSVLEVGVNLKKLNYHYERMLVNIENFESKMHAYATARCRLYLKARWAERNKAINGS